MALRAMNVRVNTGVRLVGLSSRMGIIRVRPAFAAE
jgi:hypothetical protein